MSIEGEKRNGAGAHKRLEVGPRGVPAFRRSVVAFIEDFVKDLKSLVGQPDLVSVGVNEKPGHCIGSVDRHLRTALHTNVTSRLLNPVQERFNPRP
ncbi:unannotated protein [freshwater metagenome]|uniref:Unannotated protein n=1 Tax=freshwater metagenome TaxID=449393 RepID=A0A6J7DQH0_9ZZZZ